MGKYTVRADFESHGFSEEFKHLFFALRAVKTGLKHGAKVTIESTKETSNEA